jgi:hypothetical protein
MAFGSYTTVDSVVKKHKLRLVNGPVALRNLDTLSQMLNAVFRACRDMALAHPAPAIIP